MFFYMSKIFWFFADPGNVLLIALCLGSLLIYRRRDKLGRWLVSFAALMAILIAIVPVGTNLRLLLENRFPIVEELPEKVDGIIVLGGVVDEVVTVARGQMSIGSAVERLTEFAKLSNKYPEAKLVFTSGSGKLLTQNIKEGEVVGDLLRTLGVDMSRLIVESNSRNTYENALMSMELVEPKPDETWVLITSAFHMPRSVGIFRKLGWNVLPYPVDFYLQGDEHFEISFNLIGGLNSFSGGLHEWLGLAFYWLTDKTDTLFPGPKS